jgi:GAF domain-containing protein
MAQPDPSAVLTAVARLVAEAPSLREVVSRLAVTLRESIPFERLHVLRLDRAESFVLYVARASGELEVTGHRIGDEGVPIDPADASAQSRILCAVRQGARVHGAVWVASSVADAFTDAHQALVDSVVDLLGLAFEHNAIVDREKLRRERIDSLRGLLHTMSSAAACRTTSSR